MSSHKLQKNDHGDRVIPSIIIDEDASSLSTPRPAVTTKSTRHYENETLEEAVNLVLADKMSQRQAAAKFNIPRSTIQRHVHIQKNLQEDLARQLNEVEYGDLLDSSTPANITNSTGGKLSLKQSPNVASGPHQVLNCHIRSLQRSSGHAIDELSNDMIRDGIEVYKLGLGQSPFPIPKSLVEELKVHAHQRDYLPIAGLHALRESIAEWGALTYARGFTRDNVLVGPGTKELLYVLQTVYYGELLVPSPSCSTYAPQAELIGRPMHWLETIPTDRWLLQPEVLDGHCAKDPNCPRILILCSPSNPTGTSYDDAELQALARVARKYRLLVVSDEMYAEMHHTNNHVSISKYYPEGTIVSGGLSKNFGAGGWRVGYWLFPDNLDWLRNAMIVMGSETYTSVASPCQYAAIKAFQPCKELRIYKQRCRTILQVIGRWCILQLEKVNIEVITPNGGFCLFPCFHHHRRELLRRGIMTDVELCEQLLNDTGIAILPGSTFGRNPEDLYARLAYVDIDGVLALDIIDSHLSDFKKIEEFMQLACRKLVLAMHKLGEWLMNPNPGYDSSTMDILSLPSMV